MTKLTIPLSKDKTLYGRDRTSRTFGLRECREGEVYLGKGGGNNMSTKLQNNKNNTKQVRIDKELHKELKIVAASKGVVMTNILNLIIKNYLYETNTHREGSDL